MQSPKVHKFHDSTRICHSCSSSFHYDHFECSFINADSSVVPDTLMYMILTSTHVAVDGCPERASSKLVRPPFEYFLPFPNFPLTYSLISIPNCQTSVTYARPQKSDHTPLLLFGAFCQCSSHSKPVTEISLLKRQ
jgi:hypothetical protein